MSRFTDRLDRTYVRMGAYAAATIAVAYAGCMLVSYSGGFFEKLWGLVTAVVVPMVYGGIISYLLLPVVRRACALVERTRLGRGGHHRAWNVAVALSVALVLACIGAIVAVLLVMVTRSLSGVSLEGLKGLLEDTQGDIDEFLGVIKDAVSGLGLSTEGFGTAASSVVSAVSDALSTALFSVIFAIYFLLDGTSVTSYGRRLAHALFGDRPNARMGQLLADADHVFSGYIRGQFVDALIVGVLASVAFTAVGVPYGAVAGMLMGIGNLIPYVGTPTGVISVVLVCLAQGAYRELVLGLVSIAVIGFVDGNIINPRLLSQNVDIHPLLVIAALIAGGAIGGIAGMLVAVPAAAFLKLQLDRWMEARETTEPGA